MAFGVFLHRADSIYDDIPDQRYQFPKPYLARARACVGGWVLYYEPRGVKESRGYFAIASVEQVVPDPTASGMYLALIARQSYLPFTRPVPFKTDAGPIERGLLNEEGQLSGRAQSAVRPLSVADFNRIFDLGFPNGTDLPRTDAPGEALQFSETQTPYLFEQPRDRIAHLGSRLVRDRVFRQVVVEAYNSRCAVTGLTLINGGGRAEVEAAHIRPVEARGPDIVNNGLALSGTAHWMFDRGLIGLADDLTILVSRQVNDAGAVRGLINASGRANLPLRLGDRPHPRFLGWHREHRFKN